MMDRTLSGTRCWTVRPILHHAGYLPRRLGGTVRYAVQNLDRRLLNVDFDSGQSMMVFPEDVVMDDTEARPE